MMARNEGRPRNGEAYEWMMRAACRGMGDDLFPEASAQQSARGICTKCPVRRECLAVALDDRIEWGVWGGMTERERRALLRERPGVKSWWAAFGLDTMRTAPLPGNGSRTAGRGVRPAPVGAAVRGAGTAAPPVGGSPLTGTQGGRRARTNGCAGGRAEPGATRRAVQQDHA